jgi:hypothetical protein
MALSKAEGPFDRLMALSKAEGLRCSSGFARLEFGAFYFAIEF